MYCVIIAGGRDFDDYPLLERTVDRFLENIRDEITIFCGKARGADSLGERYGKSRGYAVEYFPPDWRRYGQGAGPARTSPIRAKKERTNSGECDIIAAEKAGRGKQWSG